MMRRQVKAGKLRWLVARAAVTSTEWRRTHKTALLSHVSPTYVVKNATICHFCRFCGG